MLRDIAFVTLFLCCASTLLFNANPLLRFDGYHLLCDLLELPNLAIRSQAYWMHLALRLLGAAARPHRLSGAASVSGLRCTCRPPSLIASRWRSPSRSGSARNRNGLGGWPRS